MKKLLFTIMFLLSVTSYAGVNLNCSLESNGESYADSEMSGHVLLGGSIQANCRDSKYDKYSVQISGIGPGLEFDAGAAFILSCPTVSKKRLIRKGQAILGTLNVSATPLFGAMAGIALNHRGGSCFLIGITGGLGVSVKVGYMKIMSGSLEQNF